MAESKLDSTIRNHHVDSLLRRRQDHSSAQSFCAMLLYPLGHARECLMPQAAGIGLILDSHVCTDVRPANLATVQVFSPGESW